MDICREFSMGTPCAAVGMTTCVVCFYNKSDKLIVPCEEVPGESM